MSRILTLVSGGYHDGLIEYIEHFVLPDDMDFYGERAAWHRHRLAGSEKCTLVEWLLKRGGRRATEDEVLLV